MKLSRERKALAGILGLGLLTLAADQLFFSAPSTADADQRAAELLAPAASDPAAPPIPTLPDDPLESPPDRFAARLAKVAAEHAVDDQPLATDPMWTGHATQAPIESDGAKKEETAAPDQLAGVTLATVMGGGREAGVAVLVLESGKRAMVRVGRPFRGYTLERIDTKHRAAIFERNGKRVRFTIPRPLVSDDQP